MSEDILAILDPFISKAQKLGSDEVEFFAQNQQAKIVNLESNNFKSAVSNISTGVGIRVLKKKALGFTSVNSFVKSKIDKGLKDALAIAKVSKPEDNYFLPQKLPITKVQDLYDTSIESFSMDDVITHANTLLKEVKNYDSRVSIDSGSFQTIVSTSAIVNSNGINVLEKKSGFVYSVMGMAIDGSDIGTFDYETDVCTYAKNINIPKLVETYAKKVLNGLKAKKTEAFEGTAILTPDTVTDLFGLIIRSATATAIQAGSSYLQDKLGDKIAVKDLTIIDDGNIPNNVSSDSFDREGIPHQKLSVVDKGTFKGVFYDTFTANKEKLPSTGHAGGDFRNIPQINITNLTISPGKKSLDSIISEIDHGILIQRISADPDPISGNFSGVIKGGKLIKNGELSDTLKEVMAVGNIFTGLKNISHISKEIKSIKGIPSWFVPYIAINGIKYSS